MPTASKVPDYSRAATETIPYINHTVGIDSPRSILNAAPSTGFIMCVRSDGGGLRENQTQSLQMRAFAGSTASARRRLRDRLPVDSAEGFSRIDGARKNPAAPSGSFSNRWKRPCAEQPNFTWSSETTQTSSVAGCARQYRAAVSYTHLTLPTILLV